MAQQAQPLRLQLHTAGMADQLGKTLRAVDKEKIAAVFQRIGSASHQLLHSTLILPTGQGHGSAGGTAGKVRRIGNTNIKANTIAINPRFFPPGTEFYIDGIGYFAGLDFLHWHGETDTKNMLSIYTYPKRTYPFRYYTP